MVAKEGAFLPYRKCDDVPFATSTFMIHNLENDDIWLLGRHKLRRENLPGRADLRAEQVTAIGLRLDADSRFWRHTDIIGWPNEKSAQKLQAQKLARAASTFPAPE